jgi:hypothetical protein
MLGRRVGQLAQLLRDRWEAHDLASGCRPPTAHDGADTLIADKAFDADARVLKPLVTADKTALIPQRANRS